MNQLEINRNYNKSRRDFVSKVLPVSALFCVGCPKIFSNQVKIDEKDSSYESMDISKDSNMSYEDVFNFAYRDNYIPDMISLAEKLGREKFVEILKETASKAMTRKDVEKNWNTSYTKTFWENVLKREVVEKTEEALELKITECLWAKIFRGENAADIGYAAICYPDFARAEASGSKLIRTKTLMQGDDCCNHRWIDKK